MKRTFKKAVSVFLVVAMLLCAAPLGGFVGLDLPSLFDFKAEAESYSGTCGDNLNWSLDTETGVLEITGTGAMINWSSSSSVPWYSYRSNIKTINILSGVTSIGSYAFFYCNITSVTIPDSVTSIGNSAFYSCRSLASVTIGNSVTSIGYRAFEGCTSLASVTIPDSVTSIGDSAFYGCTSLASVTIPDSVTSIGSSAFYSCTSLESVTIGNSVTSIGSSAFYGCTSLTSVTIPDSVTSIGSSAFYGCSKLELMLKKDSYAETYAKNNSLSYYYIYDGSEDKTISVTVTSKLSFEIDKETYTMEVNCSGDMFSFSDENAPWVSYKGYVKHIIVNDGCTSISANAFENMYGLGSITIPDSVTSIGSDAFSYCRSLASVTIPDSVTSIGNYAFSGCSSLASVTIGNSVTSIGSEAFSGCRSLASVTIPDSVTSIGSYAFSGCSSLASITIPDSVTSIGSYAFYYCSSLTSVTIPDSVTSIGNGAFYGCSSLANITVDEGNTVYSSDEYGVLFNKNKTHLIQYPAGNEHTSYTIPDSVTSIGYRAFYGCTCLTSITIPDRVDYLGDSAFYNCSNLESVTIPDSVTSIGSHAFYGCTSLAIVTIPDSVISIGSSAFSGCTSLMSITIPDSITSIGEYAFYGCSGLRELTMPISTIIYNSSNTFYNCTNIEKITLTKGNGTVQNYGTSTSVSSTSTYYQYTPWYISREKCTEVIIEDGVTGIGDYMFYNCAEIDDIVLPISVQAIGTNAFVGCQKLGKLKVYNRNCVFESNATAYYTTIVGYAGSTAEAYANENGFSFEPISDDDHDHTYSNSCDNECNICGYIDPDRGHSFDNGCDPECDVCGYIRTDLVHTYTHDCDPDCDFCGYTRTDLVHKDENSDGKCDACGEYLSDIQVGVTQNLKVTAGKTVLLKFVPAQSGVYTFTASSSSDTYGYIYDADKKQLASNDDSGEGNNFLITYTLKRGTVYYLGVKFYSSSASGEIPVKLSLDQIICDHIRTHTEHKDSTCSQEGYDKVICDDCGNTVSTTTIAKVPHKYKTIVAEPTCVDEGVVVCLCSVCRDAYIDEILDPLGHSEPVWKTVVKPTTSSEGTMNHVCPACDEVFDTKSIPAITLSGNSTAVVNFTTNTITGFNAGSTELDDYLSATNNGYVFTCSSDILCTGAVVELTDGETLINSYTVVVFGDVDGNGWYDANDAFIVNMIVSGLLPQENLPDYMRTAADCNHDGEINELDFDLLINASVLLDDVDQSATQPELATQSAYIEYMSIIDQSVSLEVDDTAPETDKTVEPAGPAEDFDFGSFLAKLFLFIRKIFNLVFSLVI